MNNNKNTQLTRKNESVNWIFQEPYCSRTTVDTFPYNLLVKSRNSNVGVIHSVISIKYVRSWWFYYVFENDLDKSDIFLLLVILTNDGTCMRKGNQ